MQQHNKSFPMVFTRCRGVSFALEFASSSRCLGALCGLAPSTVVAESGGKVFLVECLVELAVFHVVSGWCSERLEYDLGLLGENGGLFGGYFLGGCLLGYFFWYDLGLLLGVSVSSDSSLILTPSKAVAFFFLCVRFLLLGELDSSRALLCLEDLDFLLLGESDSSRALIFLEDFFFFFLGESDRSRALVFFEDLDFFFLGESERSRALVFFEDLDFFFFFFEDFFALSDSTSSPTDRLRLEFDVDLSRTELSPADLLRALFFSVPSIDLDLDLPRVTGLRDFFVFDLPRGDLFAGSPDREESENSS